MTVTTRHCCNQMNHLETLEFIENKFGFIKREFLYTKFLRGAGRNGEKHCEISTEGFENGKFPQEHKGNEQNYIIMIM